MNISEVFFRSVLLRTVLMLLSVCLLVGVTYFSYWSETIASVSAEQALLLKKQQELSLNSYKTLVYVSQQASRNALYEQASRRVLKMAANSSSIQVTQHINHIAKATHIQKTDIRWLSETIFPSYIEKTFELKLVGDFSALEQFFHTLAEHERLLSFSYSQWVKNNQAENIVVIVQGHSYQWTAAAERL